MNFKKLCTDAEKFLSIYKNNSFLYSNSSAHILKNHPEFYQILKTKKNKKKIINYLSSLTKNFFHKRLFKKKIFVNKQVLVISNLLDQSHLKNKNDFYFGDIQLFFKKIKISNLFILRNFTKINSNLLNESKNSKGRYILPSTTDFHYEILLVLTFLKNYIWEKFKLFFDFKNKKINFRRFLNFNSMKTSISNQRLAYQIVNIAKNIKPKIIFYTFEGHAWERLLIKQIRKKISSEIILIGYQFSTLTKTSYSIFKIREFEYMPNYILTSGSISKKLFLNYKTLHSRRIFQLGSIKNNKFNFKSYHKNKNILVLPEGFESETELLIKFIISISKYNKDYKFIFRTHPLVDHKNIKTKITNYKNILLSQNKNLKDDIKNSSYVFYRGTGAVFECIFNNLHPVYIDNNDGINVDPLFFINSRSILGIDKNKINLNNFLKHRHKNSKKVFKMANKFYSKLNYKCLEQIIKKEIR